MELRGQGRPQGEHMKKDEALKLIHQAQNVLLEMFDESDSENKVLINKVFGDLFDIRKQIKNIGE